MIQTARPSTFLAPFVKSFWMIESRMAAGKEHVQRIVPTGLIELSFYLTDKPAKEGQTGSFPDHAIITGQINQYFDLHLSGRLCLFSIYFYPHGLSTFIDIPVEELHNQTVPMKYLLGSEGKELEDKLASAQSFQNRVNIVESFLHQRLAQKKQNPDESRITQSILQINESRGQIHINRLASLACLSRKQFERVFLKRVGISPKQFLKIIRFQNALHLKATRKNYSLTELAYDCGYYDQSHMIREFTRLSGKTPKAYFFEGQPHSDYFQ
jgi:AraC-like DNA-binding protein